MGKANLCGFVEKCESFYYESFASGITYIVYKRPGLVPQKYYYKNPYTVDTVKV